MMFAIGMILGIFSTLLIYAMMKYAYRYIIHTGDYVYFFIEDIKIIGKVVDVVDDKVIILGLHGKKFSVLKRDCFAI